APAGPARGAPPPHRRSSPSPRGGRAHRPLPAARARARRPPPPANPLVAHAPRGFQLYPPRALPGALPQFREASRLEPRSSQFRAVLGDLYAQQRALKQAANEYRAAIMLAPWDTTLYERLGIIFERLDRPRQAAAVYKNVIWIEARDAAAHQH